MTEPTPARAGDDEIEQACVQQMDCCTFKYDDTALDGFREGFTRGVEWENRRASPSAQERKAKMDWIEWERTFRQAFEKHPFWARRCEGTPLANDIAVTAANIVCHHLDQPPAEGSPSAQEPVAHDPKQCVYCIVGEDRHTAPAFDPAKQETTAEQKLTAAGVFKGAHGLRGLAEADAFWDEQPYGTRLYYGPGTTDYLQRGILRSAVKLLDAAPDAPQAQAVDGPDLRLMIAASIIGTGAVHDVVAERQRQISAEGYDQAHDDEHKCDEIAAMAAFYAMTEAMREWPTPDASWGQNLGACIKPDGWGAKTGDRRRELVNAGALILAEIERLDRAVQEK